jgi:hypothetical protein
LQRSRPDQEFLLCIQDAPSTKSRILRISVNP